jgi:predicted Rossmann-fold nucleotide-binding protein
MTLDQEIQEFMHSQSIQKIVGFSGGADDNEEHLRYHVRNAMNLFANEPVAVLTGGTKYGMPLVAFEEAKIAGLPTIGVMPSRAIEKGQDIPGLDFKVIVPPRCGISEFGDESEVFAKVADGIIYLGGMYGTLIEYAHVMKINQGRVKKGGKIIYVAPIQGFGGVSEFAMNLPMPEEFQKCLPENKLRSGEEAARYLLNRLFPEKTINSTTEFT